MSLKGKTIVVTRAREQASGFAGELAKSGAKVVYFPAIEIVEPENFAELDQAIENLSNYEWLVFTSANGAEFFLRRLETRNIETAELDNLLVAVIGEATAERLRLAQIHVDVLPSVSNAEGLFAELQNYIGTNNFTGLHFLFPRSEIAREVLPEKLRQAGAVVDDVVAYRTILPRSPETGKLKALLAGGAIDCITFASPSAFNNFKQIFSDSDLRVLLADAAIACIGTTTANAVNESGLEVQIVAPDSDHKSFAKTIADFFA